MVRPRERHSAAACAGSSAGQSEELSRHTRPGHSRSAAARPVLAIHYVLGLAVAIWRAVSAGAGRSQAHHSGCGDQSSATSAPTGGDKASRAHVPGASSISGAAPPTPPQISCAHAAGSLLTLRNRRTGGAPQGRSRPRARGRRAGYAQQVGARRETAIRLARRRRSLSARTQAMHALRNYTLEYSTGTTSISQGMSFGIRTTDKSAL